MARLPRLEIEGAIYYITCRGAHNENLFREKRDFQMYLELLEKYKTEHNFKLFAYVLLSEHLHILLEPSDKAGISDIMRSLNTAYSKYFNSGYERKGHLFRERFKASTVEKDVYLAKLASYIHLNPVRLGLATNIYDYPYSSAYLYNRELDSAHPEIKEVLVNMGGVTLVDYLEIVKQEMPDLHKRLTRGGVLGSKEFIEKIKQNIISESVKEFQEDQPQEKKNYWFLAGAVLAILAAAGAVATVFKPQSKQTTTGSDKAAIETNSATETKSIKNSLDDSQWEIKLSPLNGTSQEFSDRLSFSQGKFISDKFANEGLAAINYSISEESGKSTWETIGNVSGTTLFWRGEVSDNRMQGTLSLRSKDKAQDFSFVSTGYRRK